MNRKYKLGITLIELVVVFSVLGIVVSLLLGGIQHARESARRLQCENNMRQQILGIQLYESSFRKFPAGIERNGGNTWLVSVLPFIEQSVLFQESRYAFQFDPTPFGHPGMTQVVPTYQCPSNPESGIAHWTHNNRLVACTDYVGVNGIDYQSLDGAFFVDSAIRFGDIHDGASNTILIGERPPSSDFWYGWWYAGVGIQGTGASDMLLGANELLDNPENQRYLAQCGGRHYFRMGRRRQQCDCLHFWSYHPGGALFAFGDGSVRLIGYSSNSVLPRFATISAGDIASE
jgi:Tfp pilus assembly protein PilE